jgi:putative membrane protein
MKAESSMKRLISALAFAVPLAALAAATSPDESFYKKAAEGGISEVVQGKLAQEKSSDPGVKAFGAMMVKDHTAANDRLKAIAAAKGIDLPTTSGATEMATEAKLQALSGSTFDKSYISGMVKDHKEDIKEFENEAQNGQDPEAKAFAAKTLPTLKLHLSKIESIAASDGVKTE